MEGSIFAGASAAPAPICALPTGSTQNRNLADLAASEREVLWRNHKQRVLVDRIDHHPMGDGIAGLGIGAKQGDATFEFQRLLERGADRRIDPVAWVHPLKPSTEKSRHAFIIVPTPVIE